jgi:hypothetical protein
MILIRPKLDALVASIKTTYPGESPIRQYARVAVDSASLVGAIVGSLDEVDKATDLKSIRKEVSEFSQELVADIDVPWGMETLIPVLVGVAISKLDTTTDEIELIKQQHVKPFFQFFKDFGDAGLAHIQS